MVWSAFIGFDKCPLVIVPPHKRTTNNFVTIVYKATLSEFYFFHDHPQQLKLIEDGVPVYLSSLLLQRRQAYSMANQIWPTNSPYLNLVENL